MGGYRHDRLVMVEAPDEWLQTGLELACHDVLMEEELAGGAADVAVPRRPNCLAGWLTPALICA